jgi:ribonuclease HI
VNPNINADVVIHGAGLLGIATAESVYVRLSDLPTELTTVYGGASVYGGDGSEFSLTLKSGTVLKLPLQEIWAGVRIHEMRGSAVLYFDGASRNNPKGPAGFGYCIIRGQGGQENELVRGYGYYKSGTNNEMEYKGLLEGLTWALRLDLKTLHIRGDSELVIRQCNNEYQVNDAQLQVYYEKISELLQKGRNMGTEIFLEHISRDKNSRADWMANLGIDSQTHATVCNWNNINRLCRR